MRLYLNVPYSEKDEAKALGAKWNVKAKKWYTDVQADEYIKFSKWILRDTDDAIIATEYILLLKVSKSAGNAEILQLSLDLE